MKKLTLACALMAAMAANVGAYCATYGSSPTMLIPNFNSGGDEFSRCIAYDLRVLWSSGTFAGGNGWLPSLWTDSIHAYTSAGVTISSQVTISGSSLTVTGNAFSVGGSTFVVAGGSTSIGYGLTAKTVAFGTNDLVTDSVNHRVGFGTINPATRAHLSSGTILVDGNVDPNVQTTGSISLRPSQTNVVAASLFSSGYGIGMDSSDMVLWGSANQGISIKDAANQGYNGNVIARFMGPSKGGPALAIGRALGASPSAQFEVRSSTPPTYPVVLISSQDASVMFTVLGNGNVGIGNSAPATSLDVTGTSQFGTVAKSTFSTAGRLTMGSDFYVGDSTFVVTGNKVGVGTASPARALVVKPTGTDGLSIRENDDGNEAIFLRGDATAGRILINDTGSATIDLRGQTGQNSYFNTGANLGIGTAAPGTTLDVNGAATVRGQETVTSSMTVQGQDASGFSVKVASSISVAAGHINLASGSDGIWFGDGTKQITAAGNGTGDVTKAGNNAFTGNNTHAGTEAFNSTATFNGTISSITAPTANALYSLFLPKVAIIYSATSSSITTYGAINVSSVTRTGTGTSRINFATPMSGTHYACQCTASSSSDFCCIDNSPGKTTTAVNIVTENNSGSGVDPTLGIIVMCWDYGNTAQ